MLALLLVISYVACGSEDAVGPSESDAVAIDLLDRSEGIRLNDEWDRVQNQYAQHVATLRDSPTDAAAHLGIARLFIYEARVTGEHGHYYPGALTHVQAALNSPSLTPDEKFQALTIKSSVQLSQHDFAEALATAQMAERLNPRAATVYGALTDANVELGNYEAAVAAGDRMVQIKPDLRSYARISYLRQIHGDVPGSLEAMRLALDAGTKGTEDVAWVRTTLADLLAEYGRRDEARDQYNLVLEERPGYVFAKAGLAELAVADGNYEEAERLLQSGIEDVPEVGLYQALIPIYQATKRDALAAQTRDEVLAMYADDEVHGHNMDLEYVGYYLGPDLDLDKAYTYAQREYEKRPKNIDVNAKLAEIEVLRGNLEQAAAHLEVASSTNTQSPRLQHVRAALAAAQGNRAEAQKIYRGTRDRYGKPDGALGAYLSSELTL